MSLRQQRMEPLLHNMDSHSSHDDQWCIVSTDNQLPLCIACLVEHLEEQSLTMVERQFKLSLLASTMKGNEEALHLFHEKPLVVQHVLDILTDHYTDSSFLADSIQICAQLMDTLQSEELYVYLLDKFQHQVRDGTSIYTFVVGLLGKLSEISSAYVLTLITSHESLLVLLMEMFISMSTDEACSCSLMSLLRRLLEVDVVPVVSSRVLPTVEQCLLHCLTSAQPANVHAHAVAVLKSLLQTERCLQADSECWTELLLGLKRLFVSKKETLVIAATQCLVLIATTPRHQLVLCHRVLEDDLSEFLFEALHTMNAAQLKAVFHCLLLFSEHDQFYKKCHAIYGLESVLRSLDVLLETQNVTVLAKGYSLLSNVLERHPSSIPLFVNQSAAELTMSVVTKGARCHALHVVYPALTAATALFKQSKVGGKPEFSGYKQTLVEAALTHVSRVLGSEDRSGTESSILPVTHLQFMTVLLELLATVLVCGGEGHEGYEVLLQQIVEACHDRVVPYFSDHFQVCDNANLRSLFHFLNTAYKTHADNVHKVSEKALTSGLATQILTKKPEFRCDLDLLTSANSFIENVFQSLLKEESALCQSPSDYLTSGLQRLSLKGSIGETVSELWDEDTAAALCMLLYFSCLSEPDLFSPLQIGQVLCQLQEKGMLGRFAQKPPTTKFILYLLAFADSSVEDRMDCNTLQEVERTVVSSVVSEGCVSQWATPHPDVFQWVFGTAHRAQHLGTPLLEHWLLHTKGAVATPTSGGEGSGMGPTHVVCTLFFNSHFRGTLFNLMASSSEEISMLSKKLVMILIKSDGGRSEDESVQLIRLIHDEVMSQFHSLFLLSVQPLRHCVNSFLQTMVALLQHPMCEPSEADQTRQIGLIYHMVHYIGAADSEDDELLYNGMTCLDCMNKTMDEEQDKTVVPVLLQNTSFMQQLERCLHRKGRQASVALSVAAWISSSSPSCQTDWPITLSTDFILETLTKSTRELAAAALKILYLSLTQSHPAQPCPLTFQASHTFYQEGPLYTVQQLRLIFIHVQQYVCSESKETQFFAVKCYLEILNHSNLFHKELGDHLLRHPWNRHLLHVVLTKTALSGMQLHTAELVHRIWNPEDDNNHSEVAKMVLESVLTTEVDDENQDLLQLLVQKAKTHCHDKDLKEQSSLKLAAFENFLSFSQNTLVSA